MSQSEQINEIAAALAKAQGQIKNPTKNCTVKVKTKAGYEYEFKYADLSAVTEAIKKPLSDNGIAYTQYVEEVESRFRLVTVLLHSSNQWLKSIYPLFVGEQGSQAFGSAQTYMKRYALCSMLGVSADTDDDANAAEGNQAQVSNGKRQNPHVNRPEDFAEHEVQYDVDGNPVDNIPYGNPNLQPLRGVSARAEYEKLQSELIAINDVGNLRKWANLSQTKDRVQTLSSDWQHHIRDLYEGRKKELSAK